MGKAKRTADHEPGPATEAEPLEVAIAGAKLGVALLLGLAASASALLEAFRGTVPVAGAAQRFLVAFLLARLGIAVVWSLYTGYRSGGQPSGERAGRRSAFDPATDAVNETR